MTILAIDLGTKRAGTAINPYGDIVIELKTISFKEADYLVAEIKEIIKEYDAKMIIMGKPQQNTPLDELTSKITNEIAGIDFEFVDEAFSTKEAERQFQEEGTKQGDTDSRAAKIILEQYLNNNQLL